MGINTQFNKRKCLTIPKSLFEHLENIYRMQCPHGKPTFSNIINYGLDRFTCERQKGNIR